MQKTRGRPRPIPPPGYLTIKSAADALDASYSTVYRAVQDKLVRSKQQGSTRFVLEVDLTKIRTALDAPHAAAHADGRKAVYLRPDLERYERWERAAGQDKVSTWVAGLADAASGGR